TATLTISATGSVGNTGLDHPVTIGLSTAGSATIIDDYSYTPTSLTFTTGDFTSQQKSTTVNVVDDLIVEADETVVFSISSGVPALSGAVTWNGVSHTLTIQDNDSATVSIAKISDGAEMNTPTPGKFRVAQTLASSTPTVVNYTVGGTATPGGDYTALSGTVTIPAGALFADIDVTVLNDSVVEGTETVSVTLNSITSGDPDISINLGGNSASLDVTDNDTATVSVNGAIQGNEGSPGTVNATFTVTQSAQSSTDTVVNFTLGGTAVEGSDYTPITHSVTIPAAATTATITIPVTNDALLEGTETVTVTLSSLGAHDPDITLSSNPSELTASRNIADNESATLAIGASNSVTEPGGAQNIGVTLTISGSGTGTFALGAGITLT